MVDGGMKCIKFVIFAFNFVFVLVACGLIGLGIYIQVSLSEFFDFFGNQFTGPGIVLIVVGLVIFVVATFGCCGALKENYCCIMAFAVLLAVIFIIQIAAGISGFVLREELKAQVEEALTSAKKNYGKKSGVTITWDKLQQKFECCGVRNYTDWYGVLTPPKVPTSCCKDNSSSACTNRTDNEELSPNDFYTKDCVDSFVEWIASEIGIVGGAGIGLAFVEIVGIILACCLAVAIRKEYKVL